MKKRINNIEKYLNVVKEGENINIIYPILKKDKKVTRCGFSDEQNIGEEILPRVIGPVSDFNARGKSIALKNEEKEIRIIERPYHVIDWQGGDHYGIAYDPRECYKRMFITPPSVELRIIERNRKKCISVKPLPKKQENYELIKHQINLFLELFGECDILKEDEEFFDHVEVKKLNWKVLLDNCETK